MRKFWCVLIIICFAGMGFIPAAVNAAADPGASVSVSPDGTDAVYTRLPLVMIETDDGKAPSEKKEKHRGRLRIYYPDGSVYDSDDWLDSGDFTIHARGNATALLPKTPYKLKLPKKANLIDPSSGTDKDKEWVLLAEYSDKTLLRTQTGFYIASLFNDIPGNAQLYVPNACFTDVMLNGEYLGVYILADQVKEGSGRAAVNQRASDPGGIGFVAEYDYNYYRQEPRWFRSSLKKYPYTFKFPETDDPAFDGYMVYFKGYINAFEAALFDEDSDEWMEYIDVESFARWFLINNITANIDANFYFTKKTSDDSSKLVMGPVWDLEWSFGIGWYDGERPRDPDYWCTAFWYYEELLKKPEFILETKRQWHKLNREYPDLAGTITARMDALASRISFAQQINFRKWKILNKKISVGGVPLGSYEAELECDKAFVRARIEWLDSAIRELSSPVEQELLKQYARPGTGMPDTN